VRWGSHEGLKRRLVGRYVGTLEGKAAGALPKEGTDPVNQVGAYLSRAEEGEQDR